MNKTIYLFRHGLATHSKRGYGKGIVSAHILPEGIPPIQKIGTHLKNISNCLYFSSEFIRCRETNAIVTQLTGKSFDYDSRLNEKYKETIGDVRKRVSEFLKDVSFLPQTNIILCTHGVIIAAIKNLLFSSKFVTKHLVDYPLTGELMIIEEKSFKTINFNTKSSNPHWLTSQH
jgi:broad specificity phosphatase PhoE